MEGESFVDLRFPLCGVDLSQSFDRQPNRPTQGGGYARTTPVGLNVRAYEPSSQRARGGQRPGLSRYINATVNGAALIQELGAVVGTQGSVVQTSQSGRVVTVVAVSVGVTYAAPAGATVWTAANLGGSISNPAFNTTGLVMSAPNNQLLYMVDGTNARYYDPSTNTIYPWTATAGTFPVNTSGGKPRLICTWRGRTVLSGLVDDNQNWFMSAVNDPSDWDYAPLSPSATDAVAGNNSDMGLIGDMVTALVPLSDDVLLMGCDHELWLIRGDPMAGGQIDQVSKAIGMAWGAPWCQDPMGGVYFFSNQSGIYTLVPGQKPERISNAIDPLLNSVNTGTHTIRLIWNDRFQGLHVFITKTASSAATTHYFFERRTGAWWMDQMPNAMNPLCCCVFDGNSATDRVSLIGSWDGYVRSIDPDADDDDGTDIESEVVIGPVLTNNLDEMLCKDLQAVLGDGSGAVQFAVYVGETAETALNSDPAVEGTWEAGRNFNTFIRRAGYAVYVKLTASNPWAMEAIRARFAPQGKVRRRGR